MERYITFFGILSQHTEAVKLLQSGTMPADFESLVADASRKSGVRIYNYHQTCQWAGQLRTQKNISLAFTEAIADYQKAIKTRRAIQRTLKRNLANDLQLRKKNNIDIAKYRILRHVDTLPSTRMRTVLVDSGNEHLITTGENYLAVPADSSWYVVQPWDNAIFVDEHDNIQLAVVREVGSSRLEMLSYISSVVKEAANDRKTVRPSHPGDMIQFGQNAGQRHRRFYGLVRNILQKTLPQSDRERKDRQILGVFGLSWAIFQSVLPKQITDACENATEKSGMPHMTHQGDSEVKGYQLDLPDGFINYPLHDRAPSEGYLVDNYSSPVHTDKTFCDFTLSWNTSYDTQKCQKDDKRASYTLGGNFVDVSLKVVVLNSVGTVLGTKPNHKHGTTRAQPGLERQGIAINWSTHILKAFQDLEDSIEKGELLVYDDTDHDDEGDEYI